MTLLNDDILTPILEFRDGSRERAFVDVRHEKLRNRFFILLLSVLAYLLVVVGLARLEIVPADDSNMRFRVGVALWVMLICVVLMALSSRMCKLIGPMWFELATAAVVIHFAILSVLLNPWIFSERAADKSELEDSHWGRHSKVAHGYSKFDGKAEHRLHLLLAVCHFMMPLRWKMLLPLEITCVLCYFVEAILLGIGSQFLGECVVFATYTCTVSVGKRDLETYERTAFVQVAQERTLRAQAEGRLTEAEALNAAAQPGSDAGSGQGTSVTGQIFDVANRGSNTVTGHLEQMVQLGLEERWLVQEGDLQLESDCVLGQGGFGIVVRALYHGAEVAVKMATITGTRVPISKLLATAQELRIFRRLRHPNIVQCYGAYINPGNRDIALVLEYVRGVSLRKAVVGPCLSLPACSFRCQLINDVCCGVSYLHGLEPAIIHGDIKDSNVMVERMGALAKGKLLDFGLSRLLTPSARKLGGTVRWMAPEVITTQEGAVTLGADIFSLGRLIYYIMVGARPLWNVDTSYVCAQAYSGMCPALEWPEEVWLEKETRDIVAACTSFEASSRPCIKVVQAMLRTWTASLSPELATTVASAFPSLSKPLSDFEAGLSRARAGITGGGTNARSETHGVGRHISAANRVLHVGFETTPEKTMALSLLKTISSWNVPTHFDGCCELHLTATVAQKVLDNIHSTSCATLGITQAVQCSRCLMLDSAAQWATAKRCCVCGNELAETARDSLGSIPEVPEIQATDDPGEDALLHPVRENRAAAKQAQRGVLDEEDGDDGGNHHRIAL